MALNWHETSEIGVSKKWKCGYCGREVAGNIGYERSNSLDKVIYICPHCQNPTVFLYYQFDTVQIPGPVAGNDVDFLPDDIDSIYQEVRKCIQHDAYTSAVLSMRKLIMHIAVEQGAEEKQSFIKYINYLEEKNWIPPNGREWADSIRTKGNEATHEIVLMGREDATQLLGFVEMLLKFMYEFPNRMKTS